IREIAEQRRVRFPYEPDRFEKILERAGIKAGPPIVIDGQRRKVYSTDDEMQGKPESEWIAEHSRALKDLRV
ncbi:MAG: hypothetical protein AB7V46_18155, partial [Thermomicrobiales bacterium]